MCVKFRKAQRDMNGITRCTTAISKFSVWLKLLQHTVGKLQPENYNKTTSTLPFLSLWTFPDFTTQTFTTLLYTDFIFANISLKSEILLAKLVRRGTFNSLLLINNSRFFSTGLALIQLSLKEEQPNIYERQNWPLAEAMLLQLTCST